MPDVWWHIKKIEANEKIYLISNIFCHWLRLWCTSQIWRFTWPTWDPPVGPRWAPCWPHEPFYLGYVIWVGTLWAPILNIAAPDVSPEIWMRPLVNTRSVCMEVPRDWSTEEASNSLECWRQSSTLIHLPLDKTAVISQTTFSIAFSWMNILEFKYVFHWICS